MDFPGNSHAAKIVTDKETEPAEPKATSEPKKVEKVVTGKAIPRKKPLGTRLKDMFINDGGGFGEYLVEKVIVPMTKDMILSIITQTADGVRGGIEQKLFGPDEAGRRSRPVTSYGTGKPVVNYTRYSTPASSRSVTTRPPGYMSRRSNSVKDIILEDREEGDLVLGELDAVIEKYGHCTVGDFYSLVGETPVNTDEEWGWTDLGQARVQKIAPREYLVSMPRPHPIEN
jgi:hypothetical protein